MGRVAGGSGGVRQPGPAGAGAPAQAVQGRARGARGDGQEERRAQEPDCGDEAPPQECHPAVVSSVVCSY